MSRLTDSHNRRGLIGRYPFAHKKHVVSRNSQKWNSLKSSLWKCSSLTIRREKIQNVCLQGRYKSHHTSTKIRQGIFPGSYKLHDQNNLDGHSQIRFHQYPVEQYHQHLVGL